jgi:hypothetical protein
MLLLYCYQQFHPTTPVAFVVATVVVISDYF